MKALVRSKTRRSALLLLLLWAAAAGMGREGAAHAGEMAPAGYTGAINTPTAEVLPLGSVNLNTTNNNPGMVSQYPGVGYFGSTTLGFGVLPGLEVVGRLASDGDGYCDQHLPTCQSGLRDLSFGAKYQLPFDLPLGSHLAAGMVDVGGAAKHFTDKYLAWTFNAVQDLDLTLGGAKGSAVYSLMSGIFGSASYHLTSDLTLSVERDTHEYWAGAGYTHEIADGLALNLAYGHKLTQAYPTQANQVSVGFTYLFGGHPLVPEGPSAVIAAQLQRMQQDSAWNGPPLPEVNPAPAGRSGAATAGGLAPANGPHQPSGRDAVSLPPAQGALNTGAEGAARSALVGLEEASPGPAAAGGGTLAPPAAPILVPPDAPTIAQGMAERLAHNGFSHINVARLNGGKGWWIRAESSGWRKNQLDGIGAALGVLVKQPLAPADQIVLTLTYLENATLTATTRFECLSRFALGDDYCDNERTFTLFNGEHIPDLSGVEWLVQDLNSSRFKPQLEFKPAFHYVIGNEYGLYNYTLGLSSGWEVPLAKGLLWTGSYVVPLDNSAQYTPPNGAFYGSRLTNSFESNYLSYTREVLERTWVELSAGYQTSSDKGERAEADWLSRDGLLRLQSVVGSFKTDNTGLVHQPAYVSGRYSIIPGMWSLDLTGGRFYDQDSGYMLTSNHWFGDYLVDFYYRKTGNGTLMPATQFLGFGLTIPLGPRQSYQLGAVSLRGGDHTLFDLATVIHNGANSITTGYGVEPTHQHGLYADVLDLDRAGVEDLWANIERVRETMLSIR